MERDPSLSSIRLCQPEFAPDTLSYPEGRGEIKRIPRVRVTCLFIIKHVNQGHRKNDTRFFRARRHVMYMYVFTNVPYWSIPSANALLTEARLPARRSPGARKREL